MCGSPHAGARVGGRRVCRKLVRHINHAFVIVREGGHRRHIREKRGDEIHKMQRASGLFEKKISNKEIAPWET